MDNIPSITTIISLVVGAVFGWVAARLSKRHLLGELLYVVIGIVGGFLGYWIWGHTPLAPESPDWFHTAAAAAVGSILLLMVWRLAWR
jgi:uncharacterized membrane protein YeaQ/YmgE (transglycosylase-associated protein family)